MISFCIILLRKSNVSKLICQYTSSDSGSEWLLSRYDAKSLYNERPTVTEIKSKQEGNSGMIFGILEAHDGSIWFGALDGVHRYDGIPLAALKIKRVRNNLYN